MAVEWNEIQQNGTARTGSLEQGACVCRAADGAGELLMTSYEVFPGIVVIYKDARLKRYCMPRLEGSRVFVQVRLENDLAVTEIKNTSRYEIDFDSDEITERFVRGDASRSTEGSGLGLSIAKTFTNACGGEFSITTNADLFCAKLEFPLSNQSPEQA